MNKKEIQKSEGTYQIDLPFTGDSNSTSVYNYTNP